VFPRHDLENEENSREGHYGSSSTVRQGSRQATGALPKQGAPISCHRPSPPVSRPAVSPRQEGYQDGNREPTTDFAVSLTSISGRSHEPQPSDRYPSPIGHSSSRRSGIPEADGAIGAGGRQAFAVGTEGDADRLPTVAGERPLVLAGLGVPELGGAIVAAGGDAIAVGTEDGSQADKD
jgi:hypothetical protein